MTVWTHQPRHQRRHRAVGEYVGDIASVGFHRVTRELNAIMGFDMPVYSDGAGTITERIDVDSPDMLYVLLDNDGQMVGSDARDGIDVLVDTALGDWLPLQGHCGAQGKSSKSFIQHPSKFIGGGLEDRILDHAGYYVAVLVDGVEDTGEPSGDDTLVGWTVLYREGE